MIVLQKNKFFIIKFKFILDVQKALNFFWISKNNNYVVINYLIDVKYM